MKIPIQLKVIVVERSNMVSLGIKIIFRDVILNYHTQRDTQRVPLKVNILLDLHLTEFIFSFLNVLTWCISWCIPTFLVHRVIDIFMY